MKAKAHAEFLLIALNNVDIEEFNKAADNVIKLLIGDYAEKMKSRNVSTKEAAYAVLREINDKWNAICRRVNKKRMILKENGFKEMIKEQMKDNSEYKILQEPPVPRRKNNEDLPRFNRPR